MDVEDEKVDGIVIGVDIIESLGRLATMDITYYPKIEQDEPIFQQSVSNEIK